VFLCALPARRLSAQARARLTVDVAAAREVRALKLIET
jgi:hypothetical protein